MRARKIHFNIIFIQAGIKSILKLEFNKLFYYWQLINQSRCQFITFFFPAASDKNRLCFLSLFSTAENIKKMKFILLAINQKAEKKRLTGIIVEEDNTRLIKQHKHHSLETKSFTSCPSHSIENENIPNSHKNIDIDNFSSFSRRKQIFSLSKKKRSILWGDSRHYNG